MPPEAAVAATDPSARPHSIKSHAPVGTVDLYWIPLGAGAHAARTSGRIYEAVAAFRQRRPRCDLYHSALVVHAPDGCYVIEQTPVPDHNGVDARGVVRSGAVGVRVLGRFRMFRYEVRRWRHGTIDDLDEAVGGAVCVCVDPELATRILDAVSALPAPVWGRDELHAGEMWNSNSVIAWTLASAGIDLTAVRPPIGGRAPGWDAGLVVAARGSADVSVAAAPPARPSVLEAMRAFAVMSGGPVVLLIGALASIGATAWALARGDEPPWYAIAGVLAFAAYLALVAPWTRRWGATRRERAMPLPGDEAVPNPGLHMTRAVTVDAPPEQVWPWLAQIGQDRGGFYSYTWLENLAGCRMHNATRIHREWQHRAVDDTVLLHPATGLQLTRFEPNRCFALGGWYLVLEPATEGRTRLLARSRIPKGAASLAYAVFVELPHFIMERRMLHTIKARAEGR